MKTHRFGLIGTLAMSFFAACLAPAAARAADADPELKQLQGTWQVVEIRDNHKLPTVEELKEMKIVIDGDKMTFFGTKGRKETMTITLDSSKSPKWMDFHVGTDAVAGIYTFSDTAMTICFNKSPSAARPAEIPTADQDAAKTLTVIVLKRDRN